MRHKTDFEEWIEFTKGDWQWFIKKGIKNVQGVLVYKWRKMADQNLGIPVVETVGNKMTGKMRPYGHIVADSEKYNSLLSFKQETLCTYVAGKGNIGAAV